MLLQFHTTASFRNSDGLVRYIFKSFLCKMSEDTGIRDFILDSELPKAKFGKGSGRKTLISQHWWDHYWHNHFGKQ